MSRIDLGKLDSIPDVLEAHELMGIWEFEINGLQEKFRVKVLGYNRTTAPYMGIANLEVKNSEQDDFYISLAFHDTVEAAVHDSLNGFLRFYDVNDPGLETRPYPHW